VLGENFSKSPVVFEQAKNILKDEIVQWGYTESSDEYAEWLWKADILPVTSNQEFFGASIMEAIYCGTWPILPDRLTYPELIPIKSQKEHLYVNKSDFYKKIIWAIQNCKRIRKTNLSAIAQQFDWQTMAPFYDKVFNTI